MATIMGALTLNLNADTAQLESDLGRAAHLHERFSAEVIAAGTAVGVVLGNALSSAASHMTELVKHAIEAADDMGKFAQKVGLTTEELSSYAVSARLADVSTTTLKTGLKALSNSAAEAVRTGGKTAEAFKAMGIELQDSEGKLKGTRELFDEVAAKMATYEDSAQKSALANAVLGRSGQELIPLMNGMSETSDLARQLGVTLDKETAAAAEKFNDNMTVSRIASEAMGLTIARTLLPTMTMLSEHLVDSAKNTTKLEMAARAADVGIKSIVTVVLTGANAFAILGKAIGGVSASVVEFVSGNFSRAFRIAGEVVSDVADGISDQARTISRTWEVQASLVDGQAENTGGKLAAPAIAAKEKVTKAVKEIDNSMRDYLRIYALIEADQQRAAQIESEIFDIQNKRGLEREAMLEREAQKWRDIADPMAVYMRNIELINELERRNDLTDTQAAAARLKLFEDAARANDKVADATKKADDIGRQLGLTFSSAFEDMIVKGAGVSDMLRGLAADVLRIFAREQITKPIAANVSGLFSSWFGSGASTGTLGADDAAALGGIGARATGGPMQGGRSYLVGERGPEIVTPDVSSWVTPNGGSPGGGMVYAPQIHVEGNMSPAEVEARIDRALRASEARMLASRYDGGAWARATGARA